MNNLMALFANNIKLTILKKKKFFALLVLAPIIFLIIYSKLMTGGSSTSIKIGLVNPSNTVASNAIVSSLKSNNMIQLINMNEDNIQSDINNKTIDFALVIPAGFENNILHGTESGLTIKAQDENDSYKAIEPVVNSEINNLKYIANASNGDEKVFNTGVENYLSKGIKLQTKNLTNLSGDYEATLSFLGILIFFMFTISSFATKSISEDRKNNIYARVFMAPVKPWQYYLANIMTCVVSLIIQIAVALLALKYLVKLELGVSTFELAIILFCTGLLAIVLELFVMSITKDDSSMLSNIIVLVMAMLGGCFVPMSVFPDYINKISMFMPPRWALQAITDLQQGFAFTSIIKYLAYTLILSFVLLILVGFITSKEEKVFKEL